MDDRAVVGVAAVASYERACDLAGAHGETGWTARMVPLTVDGLIYTSSMVMLDSARCARPVPVLARRLLGRGIMATLAANVAYGLWRGPSGVVVVSRGAARIAEVAAEPGNALLAARTLTVTFSAAAR